MKNTLMALACSLACGAFAAEMSQTGGEVIDLGYAELYKWTSTAGGNTLTVPAGGKTVDILVVGGGGAGGFCRGGGGGGGGVVYQESVALPEGVYTITVGAGGTPDVIAKSGDCYQQHGSTAGTASALQFPI